MVSSQGEVLFAVMLAFVCEWPSICSLGVGMGGGGGRLCWEKEVGWWGLGWEDAACAYVGCCWVWRGGSGVAAHLAALSGEAGRLVVLPDAAVLLRCVLVSLLLLWDVAGLRLRATSFRDLAKSGTRSLRSCTVL